MKRKTNGAASLSDAVTSLQDGITMWEKAKAFLRDHPVADKHFSDELEESATNISDDVLRDAFGDQFHVERTRIQIKKALNEAKRKSKLTQAQIAQRMHILQPAVSRIENATSISVKSLAEYLSACGFVAEIKIKPLPNASKE